MAASQGPNLGINYGWNLRENGWKPGMDANLKTVDALLQLAVIGVANSPSVVTDGTRYLVSTSPSGDFAGQSGKIAVRVAGAWEFYPPKAGMIAQVINQETEYLYTGGGWKLRFGAQTRLDVSDPAGFLLAASNFAKIPLNTVTADIGSGWNAGTSEYAPPQDGLYLLTGIARPRRASTGAIPDSVPFALGIGGTAADSENVVYNSGPVGGGLFTVSVSRTVRLTTSDTIFLFGKHFHSASVAVDSANLSVVRLSA
ncbi:tail fiber protein [Pectobacterium phage MA12]|uniref:Tail fiber protein n=1 Tax=Pectobacterium phage MA12 TaxID=2686474 RepID=A0A6B9RJU1_9CAUD|nr:tail fiber protein [Pectobacterium phage MA11]YP_010000226.1 tail fiber protein [Pectobacterium phage MA12]QGF21052.1 tail fiber protein [Pectobacterium phage MA11]QHI00831.1 tail fiber protein [Pectobacterium phage MA12]